MLRTYTSESVTDGHPDKLADQISDAIVDRVLEENPDGAAAVDTFLCGDDIIFTGAVDGGVTFDLYDVARQVIGYAGYIVPNCTIEYGSINVISRLCSREMDVFRYSEPSPGGTIYGYACNETPELMPLPTMLAHKLARLIMEDARNLIGDMRPEAGVQVSVDYEKDKPKRIRSVFVSIQCYHDTSKEDLEEEVHDFVVEALPPEYVDNETEVVVRSYNELDTGLLRAKVGFTGRRLDVDTYGGFTRNVGTIFSGRTPQFGGRAAACMARYIAKNIVAAGLADRCEVALPYVGADRKPLLPWVNTFRRDSRENIGLSKLVAMCFDLSPQAIIRTLKMNRPMYLDLAAYGCFGRSDLKVRWESTDAVKMLKGDKIPNNILVQGLENPGQDRPFIPSGNPLDFE